MSQELKDSITDYEFKCRDSDYRTVASDPNFDVVNIMADANTKGNLMMIAVTAIDKMMGQKFTHVQVILGSECYSPDEIQIIQEDVLDIKIGETWKIGYKSPMMNQLYTWDYTFHILMM